MTSRRYEVRKGSDGLKLTRKPTKHKDKLPSPTRLKRERRGGGGGGGGGGGSGSGGEWARMGCEA